MRTQKFHKRLDGKTLFSILTNEELSYDPTTPGDWSPVPDKIREALDTLASTIQNTQASAVSYTPDDNGDWNNVPTDVKEALDELASVLPIDEGTNRVLFLGPGGSITASSEFAYFKDNDGSLRVGRNLSFNGGDSSILMGRNSSLNANYAFNVGYNNSMSCNAGFAMGAGNSNGGNDSCGVMGGNNTISGSINRCVAIGGGNSLSGGDDVIVVGKNSSVDATDSMALGRNTSVNTDESIGMGQVNITTNNCQVVIGAILNTNTSPNIQNGEETITLFSRNGGGYDDGITITSGDASSRQSCTTKDHNSTLSWSYTPTTNADWSSVPDNVGEALDTLASDISGSTDASNVDYTPSFPANWTDATNPVNVEEGLDKARSTLNELEQVDSGDLSVEFTGPNDTSGPVFLSTTFTMRFVKTKNIVVGRISGELVTGDSGSNVDFVYDAGGSGPVGQVYRPDAEVNCPILITENDDVKEGRIKIEVSGLYPKITITDKGGSPLTNAGGQFGTPYAQSFTYLVN